MAGPLEKSSSFWLAKAAIAKNFANRKPPIDADTRDTLCQIVRGLYLSSCHLEAQRDVLQRNGVTHVLQVGRELSPTHPAAFTYKHVPVYDLEEEDLVKYFPECFAFIDAGRETGAVLVHCAAGVSRSASMVIGYLMATGGLSLEDARAAVKASRPAINPNQGFLLQLQLFQEAGCSAEGWQTWDLDRFLRVRSEAYSLGRSTPAVLAAADAVSSGNLMRGACELAPPVLSREDSISPSGSPTHSPARGGSSDGECLAFGPGDGGGGDGGSSAAAGDEPAALTGLAAARAPAPILRGGSHHRMSTGQVGWPPSHFAGGSGNSRSGGGGGGDLKGGRISGGVSRRSHGQDPVRDTAACGYGLPLLPAIGGVAAGAAAAAATSTWAGVVAGGGRGAASTFWRTADLSVQGQPGLSSAAAPGMAPATVPTAGLAVVQVPLPPPLQHLSPPPCPLPSPAPAAASATATDPATVPDTDAAAAPPQVLHPSRSFLRQLSADDAVGAATAPARPATLSLPNTSTSTSATPSATPTSPGPASSHSSSSPRPPAVFPPGGGPRAYAGAISPRTGLAGVGSAAPRARTISGVADAGAVAAWAATQAQDPTRAWAPIPGPVPVWAKPERAWPHGASATPVAHGAGYGTAVWSGPPGVNSGVVGDGEGSGKAGADSTGYQSWLGGRAAAAAGAVGSDAGAGATAGGGGGGAAVVPDPRAFWPSDGAPVLALPPLPDQQHQQQQHQHQRLSQPSLETGAPPALSPIPSDGGCSDETCRSEVDEDAGAGVDGSGSGHQGVSARQLRLGDVSSAAPGGGPRQGGRRPPFLRRSLSDKLQGLLERAFPPPGVVHPAPLLTSVDRAGEAAWTAAPASKLPLGGLAAPRPHALSDGAAVVAASGGPGLFSSGVDSVAGSPYGGSAGGSGLGQAQGHPQQVLAPVVAGTATHTAALRHSTDSGASSAALAAVWPDGSGSEGSSSGSSTATSRGSGGEAGAGGGTGAGACGGAEERSDATSAGAAVLSGHADGAAAVPEPTWQGTRPGPDGLPEVAPGPSVVDGLRRRWALLPVLTPAGLERTPSKIPQTETPSAAAATAAAAAADGGLADGSLTAEEGAEEATELPFDWRGDSTEALLHGGGDLARSAALSHLVAAQALSHGAMSTAAMAAAAAATAAAHAGMGAMYVRSEPEIMGSRTPSGASGAASPRNPVPAVCGFAAAAAAAAAAVHHTPGKTGGGSGAKTASRLATATFAHPAGGGGLIAGGTEGLDGFRSVRRRRECRSSSGASGVGAVADEPPVATASYDELSGCDSDGASDSAPSLQRCSAPSVVTAANHRRSSVARTAVTAATLPPADSGALSPAPAMAVPARPLRLSIRSRQGSSAGGGGTGAAGATGADPGREGGGSGTPIHKRVLRSLTSFLNRSPESPTLGGAATAAAGLIAGTAGDQAGGGGGGGRAAEDAESSPSTTAHSGLAAALRRRLWVGGKPEPAAAPMPPGASTVDAAAALTSAEAATAASGAGVFAAVGFDYFAEEAEAGASAAAAEMPQTEEVADTDGRPVSNAIHAGTLVRSEVLLPPAASALPSDPLWAPGEEGVSPPPPPPPPPPMPPSMVFGAGLSLRTPRSAIEASTSAWEDDDDNAANANDGTGAAGRGLLRSQSSSPTCAAVAARDQRPVWPPGSSTVSGGTTGGAQPGLAQELMQGLARGALAGYSQQDLRGLELSAAPRVGRELGSGSAANAAAGRGGAGLVAAWKDHEVQEEVIGLEALPEGPFRWGPGGKADGGLAAGETAALPGAAAAPADGAAGGGGWWSLHGVSCEAAAAAPVSGMGPQGAVATALTAAVAAAGSSSGGGARQSFLDGGRQSHQAASRPGTTVGVALVDPVASSPASAARAAYFSSLATVASATMGPMAEFEPGGAAAEPGSVLPAAPASVAAAFWGSSQQQPSAVPAGGPPLELQRSSSVGTHGLPAAALPSGAEFPAAHWSGPSTARDTQDRAGTGTGTGTGTGSAAAKRPRSSYSGALSMLPPTGRPGQGPRVCAGVIGAAWPPPAAMEAHQAQPQDPRASQGQLQPSPLSSPLLILQQTAAPTYNQQQLFPNSNPPMSPPPQPQRSQAAAAQYGTAAVAALAGTAAVRGSLALPAWGGSRSSASLLSMPSDLEPSPESGPAGRPDVDLDRGPVSERGAGQQPQPAAAQRPMALPSNGTAGPGPGSVAANRATVRSASTGSSAAAHAAAAAAGSLVVVGDASGTLDQLRAARHSHLQWQRLQQQQMQMMQQALQAGGGPPAADDADPRVAELAWSRGLVTGAQAEGGPTTVGMLAPGPLSSGTTGGDGMVVAATAAAAPVPVLVAATAAAATAAGTAAALNSPSAAAATAIRLSLSPAASSGGSSTSVQSPRAPPAVSDTPELDSLDLDWFEGPGFRGGGDASRRATPGRMADAAAAAAAATVVPVPAPVGAAPGRLWPDASLLKPVLGRRLLPMPSPSRIIIGSPAGTPRGSAGGVAPAAAPTAQHYLFPQRQAPSASGGAASAPSAVGTALRPTRQDPTPPEPRPTHIAELRVLLPHELATAAGTHRSGGGGGGAASAATPSSVVQGGAEGNTSGGGGAVLLSASASPGGGLDRAGSSPGPWSGQDVRSPSTMRGSLSSSDDGGPSNGPK